MYRKIFRAISPKKDYRNVSSKKPPVFAFEAWLATLPVCQVLQQFGPCAEPFQPAVHDFRVRGYQGISGTGKSGLCKPPVTGLVETFWMETAKLKCGSAIVQLEKKSVWENQPVEWIHQRIKESETLPLGWQYWAFSDGLQLLSRQSAWRPPSLPSFLWLGTDFWSRDLGWFGISHEVDSFPVLFFSTFSAMAWNWTSSLRKKIHGSLVHGFCHDGSTLIGSAIWERNVLTHNPGYAPHQLD